MRKQLILIASVASIMCGCSKAPQIANLQTEYMTTPIGIDEMNPSFSWAMKDKRYDERQASYEITVKDECGNIVFETGIVESNQSVGIRYEGEALAPCTRYDWSVNVIDGKGRRCSASSFFETGLMSSLDRSVWDGAQWIGSSIPHFSGYRSTFNINYDMEMKENSLQSGFIFGYRDSLNYTKVEFDFSTIPSELKVCHCAEGVTSEDASIDIPFAGRDYIRGRHNVNLEVKALDYALGYRIDVSLDSIPVNSNPIVVRPYPKGVWKPYSRLYSIGFFQKGGSAATYSNFSISEKVWNTTLYTNESQFMLEGGDYRIFSPAEESGAPMLRKDINIDKKLKSARLYTTARGIYEYYINGRRLTSDRFNPGSTDYRYRIAYNTYDITEYFKKGPNAVCAQLGAGWWSDFTGFATSWQDQFGTQLSLLAKIVLTYSDGSREVIVSDPSWKVYDDGPITSDSFQNGEDYDARRQVDSWSEPSFDATEWKSATVYEAPADSIEISYYIGNPVSSIITLTAQSVTEPVPGVYVYDMGQNMGGVPSIRLKGREGQEITLCYGEMVYPDEVPSEILDSLSIDIYKERKGRVYNENYRGALSTDHYIMRGDKEGETIEPHFTFHGYRYIEIHGLDNPLPLEDVKGIVLESIGEQMSSFETSDEQVNKLYSNIVWGQRGNFLSIPTDCPQRDERMGWMGDAQVFARTATYNMNVRQFYRRFLQSVRDIQGDDGNYCDYVPKVGVPPYGSLPGGGSLGWTDAGIIIPWQVYMQYGDRSILEESYSSMKRYMDYLESRSIFNLQPGSGYGDWCAVEHTTSTLTNTCYYAYDATLMSKMAKAIGKEDDAIYYLNLFNRIREAFNKEFVDENGITKESDILPPHDEWIAGGADSKFVSNTQTSYVLPLYAELFNDTNKPLAIKYLSDDIKAHGYTLTTGFIGTPYLNLVLSDNNHTEEAYRLFEQRSYPSWLYPVEQGATTIWERWNSYTIKNGFGPVDMNSFNHYSYGAIEEWMVGYMLGIVRDEDNPGYSHFTLSPQIGGTISYCKGHYDSIMGRIESGWEKSEDGYIYNCSIPANTTATLKLAQNPGQTIKFEKGGKYAAKREDGSFLLGSGEYSIIIH